MDSRREFKDDGRHDFQAESFIQLGDYLSSLERRRATASTQTSANVNAQSPNSQKTTNSHGWRTLTVKWALVVIVIVLVGTNAYVLKAKSSLEAENSTLRTRVAELDRQNEKQPSERSLGSCPNDIVDNCMFKIGLGPCAKEAFEDPIAQVEHALVLAWNSTAEMIEAVGSTIAKDFNHLGREIQSAGTAVMNLLGIPSCHRK